jgi:hypothetical protein
MDMSTVAARRATLASISASATQPLPPNPYTPFPCVHSVCLHGTEVVPVVDAMIHALLLTLLATSASLDHPYGSYCSATQEGQ